MGTPIRRLIPLVGVLTATALSVTANSVVAIAVPWLVLERTGSAALAGLAGAAAIAPIVFSAVFGGALIDRIGKRTCSMIADAFSALAVAALPIAESTIGLGIPLLLGRAFTTKDDLKAHKVAVVNQTFAERYLPGDNPIGQRFSMDIARPDPIEIIGIVKDAKYTSQREEIPATMYRPWMQTPGAINVMTFEVRTTGDPKAYVGAIRQAVRDIEPNLPLNNIKTQIEQADETLSMERLFAKLMSLFGLLAQQLASIGLYGVLAYSVSRRTHEIGIRMALGANRSRMLTMILRQGMTLTVIGIVLGLGGAYVLTKYLESLNSMLFGVQPRDPITFAASAVLLTIVALVACFVPARRATKVDPMVALRCE